MRYEIEFHGFKRHGYIAERKRGVVGFTNIHDAQRALRDLPALLERFGASAGEFTLWDEDMNPILGVSYDADKTVNRLPITYREFVRAIFAA